MAKLLLGKEVTDALNANLQTRTAALREKGIIPTLGIVRVGADPSDLSYEKGATKRAELVGVDVKKFELPADASKEDVLAVIDQVNADDSIHGVLMFRPLPKHLKADQNEICNRLDPKKDVDCMTHLSNAGVFEGLNGLGFAPAPPPPAWRFWTTTASTARARTPWSLAAAWWSASPPP
ncbi:MAG: tetrahydrofolate dehydrogenase/cyclohydrolase catalytic domain-containing protein [Oscillospiraceae bacterium]